MSIHRTVIQHLATAPSALAELQSAGQVSLPTLRRAVQDLTDAHWIRVVGQAQANGGRPAMLFGLDESHFVLIGVHLQLPGLRLIAADLTGRVLDERKLFDKTVPSPVAAVQAVADYVNHIRAHLSDRPLLGIGLAAPGFIDPATGDILSIGRVSGWENFPICKRIAAAADVAVQIANDVDCMAFAEFRYGGQLIERNLAYVGFDEGVKTSLFLGRELYQGSVGNAGLIAGNLLRVDGAIAPERVPDLLTVEGVNRLFDDAVAHSIDGEQRHYAAIAAVENPRKRFRLILASEGEEQPICAALVRELVAVLAAAVANMTLIMQPDAVVIGGLLSAMPSTHFTALEEAVRAYLPPLIRNSVIIRQATLTSSNSAAIGANQHFLQEYLNDPASRIP